MSTNPEISNRAAAEEKIKEIKLLESQMNLTPGRQKLRSWLNKTFRIKLSDGRTLVGYFLCTDKDANIILGMSSEYREDEERTLGLVIVPKKHIVKIEVGDSREDILSREII